MPLMALAAVLIIGAVGVAVDMARSQIVQSRMQSALDAAGLAGGAIVHAANLDSVVNQYFYSNFPAGYMGTSITSLTVSLNSDANVLSLAASGVMDTTVLRLIGIDTMTISVTSQVTRQVRGMELVLAMDNTGSMAQPAGGNVSKIQAAKVAAQSLLDDLYGANNNTASNLWIGVVPFSQTVNIGTSRTSWLDGSTPNFGPVADTASRTCTPYLNATVTYHNGPSCRYIIPAPPVTYAGGFGLANWQGCVEARANGSSSPQYDITDDTPSVKPFAPYHYPDDAHNFWFSIGQSQTCTGGGCQSGHYVSSTCYNYYPACCQPNDESCINPPNCGLPPTDPHPCQYFVCDRANPPTCGPITSTTSDYDYSFSNQIGSHLGPNLYCPQQPIQPMVAEKDTVLSAIQNMQPVGETEIDLGLAWAYRMLSPRWQGLWGGEMDANNLPLPFNTPLMSKVVILMTDGDNNIVSGNYSAYGYTYSNQLNNQLGIIPCSGSDCTTGINEINNRTTTVCNTMKSNGIIIYTIALGAEISQNGKNLLQACATAPTDQHYFESPTTDTLQAVFQQIGDSLVNLRVSH